MSACKKYKLINACSKIGSGATPRGGDASYKSEGISLIRSQNVLDFVFSKDGLAFIDEQQAKELANVTLKEKDVLINITGDSVARVCQVPDDILPARVNQHVAILRANQSLLNPEFLKYSLLSRNNKEMLLTLASTGATRKALTKSMLEQFEIYAPEDINTQQSIASILSSLDDKIELNRRMNQTLEQIAATLFKKYFTSNELINLNELIEFNPRLTLKKHEVATYVEMADLPEQGSSIKTSLKKQFSGGTKFQNDDTLLARITPCLENGKTAFVDILEDDKEVAFGSTEFIVMRAKANVSKYFPYFIARDKNFREYATRSMVGTSGRQRVQTDMLYSYEFNKPDNDSMNKFHKVAEPIFKKIKSNADESKTLEIIRDTLLPKLMSSEMDVTAINQNELLNDEVLI